MIRVAATDEDIARCFDVLHQLRPMLSNAEDLVSKVQRQRSEGYQLVSLEDAGEVVTVAGFRIQNILATGLTLYVDDLVTGEQFR